ncbi:hypothetical protein AK830_g5462 [Neonectria ditissima]|uniref:Xylanolytic transcriptional activator regulatory domain-containing protein n=1 Tax=Neonectria ditissima TaxID=78410 RepID=A0A0P7B3Y9_9HYPO|nr:hypothetical protein AK830_g5462 [Neonectria ditissima]
MESRGNADTGPNSRPAIARRSVRTSHDVNERKIDEIANDIRGIKSLLQTRHVPERPLRRAADLTPQSAQCEQREPQVERHTAPQSRIIPQWDHSAHILDFVKAVVEGKPSPQTGPESTQILSSLRNLVDALGGPNNTSSLFTSGDIAATHQSNPPMVPMESVVEILRWAKVHANNFRITWICRILSLEKFEEICRKVYFAVDDYTELDFIIANGFLSYVFAEHVVVYGTESSRTYPSMEAIAALTLGCLYSIEDSKAMGAWTFISAALSHCQTLGYHRLGAAKEPRGASCTDQERLFWTVYGFETGLSLRLGRSSGIQDADIMLPISPSQPRTVKVARIQKRVYNQLYSATGQSSSTEERSCSVQRLSQELKELIEEVRAEISEAVGQLGDPEADTMKIIYLHCDLVCESALLALILRATPAVQGSEVSEECVSAARNTLDMHQHCMELVRGCRDPLLVTRYITWAILHTPFVPFSIIFTRAVQLSDADDLARLDTFASSLKPQVVDTESPTHPFRLYELLCQAARLYIDSNLTSRSNAGMDSSSLLTGSEHGNITREMENNIGGFEGYDYPLSDLGDWYHSNRQLMSLLDEDMMF